MRTFLLSCVLFCKKHGCPFKSTSLAMTPEHSEMWKFIMSYKLPAFRVCITRGFTSQNQGNQRPVSHCLSSSLACVHSSATAKKACSPPLLLPRGRRERAYSFIRNWPAHHPNRSVLQSLPPSLQRNYFGSVSETAC